eukprot:sb/3476622/
MTLPCFPSGATACTKCDYFQYSSPGSDSCQPCTVSTATNNRCYYSNGHYDNLIRPIGVPADVLSFDSSTSDTVTLEADPGSSDSRGMIPLGIGGVTYDVQRVLFVFDEVTMLETK